MFPFSCVVCLAERQWDEKCAYARGNLCFYCADSFNEQRDFEFNVIWCKCGKVMNTRCSSAIFSKTPRNHGLLTKNETHLLAEGCGD